MNTTKNSAAVADANSALVIRGREGFRGHGRENHGGNIRNKIAIFIRGFIE